MRKLEVRPLEDIRKISETGLMKIRTYFMMNIGGDHLPNSNLFLLLDTVKVKKKENLLTLIMRMEDS